MFVFLASSIRFRANWPRCCCFYGLRVALSRHTREGSAPESLEKTGSLPVLEGREWAHIQGEKAQLDNLNFGKTFPFMDIFDLFMTYHFFFRLRKKFSSQGSGCGLYAVTRTAGLSSPFGIPHTKSTGLPDRLRFKIKIHGPLRQSGYSSITAPFATP